MRESVFQSERESHCESLSQRDNQRDSHKKLTPPRAHRTISYRYFDPLNDALARAAPDLVVKLDMYLTCI